jgi:hypothetical protein
MTYPTDKPCPQCGAHPGQPCIRIGSQSAGAVRWEPHFYRYAYEDAPDIEGTMTIREALDLRDAAFATGARSRDREVEGQQASINALMARCVDLQRELWPLQEQVAKVLREHNAPDLPTMSEWMLNLARVNDAHERSKANPSQRGPGVPISARGGSSWLTPSPDAGIDTRPDWQRNPYSGAE